MFASSFASQFPHSCSSMSYFEWVLDSGALHHIPRDSSSFTSISPPPSIPIITINGTSMPLASVGSIVTPHLSFLNVYLIPKIRLNLVFIGQLCDSGDYLVIFSSFFFCVQDLQSQKLIGTGRRENGLYILDELKVSVVAATVDLSSFILVIPLLVFIYGILF